MGNQADIFWISFIDIKFNFGITKKDCNVRLKTHNLIASQESNFLYLHALLIGKCFLFGQLIKKNCRPT